MFGSNSVPCFIAIGSHSLLIRHTLMILLFLQFAVSFASMQRMISIPLFRWELMKTCKSIIVLSAIFSLPLIHCGLFAIVG